jgi:hypothetical protein
VVFVWAAIGAAAARKTVRHNVKTAEIRAEFCKAERVVTGMGWIVPYSI